MSVVPARPIHRVKSLGALCSLHHNCNCPMHNGQCQHQNCTFDFDALRIGQESALVPTTPTTDKSQQQPCCLPGGLPRSTFWNPSCNCVFSCLPDDIFCTGVLSFLNVQELAKVARTCTRWDELANDSCHAENMDLSSAQVNLGPNADSVLTQILEKASDPFTHTLKLCSQRSLSDSALSSVGRLAPFLNELHLCTLLSVTDQVVHDISRHASQLQRLFIGGCTGVSDQAIIALGPALPRLEVLTLRGIRRLTDSALSNLHLHTRLRRLNLSGCSGLTAHALTSIAAKCPGLRCLNLRGVDVDDERIQRLTNSCSELEYLDVSSSNPFGGNENITDLSLYALAERLGPQLRKLNLSGAVNLSDQGLAFLTQRSPALEQLCLGHCERITDKAARAIARLSGLTHLQLFEAEQITDSGLAALAGLAKLTRLDVHGCDQITDASLELLGNRSSFVSLADLDIATGCDISSAAVATLRQRRPQLRIVFYD